MLQSPCVARAADDGRLILVDDDTLRVAKLLQRRVLQLEAQLLGDHLAAAEHCDVLQHLLAAIAEARRLDGAALQHAADLVDDQRGERFSFHVLGDDQQRLAALRDRSSSPIRSFMMLILRSVSSSRGSSRTASIFSVSVTK